MDKTQSQSESTSKGYGSIVTESCLIEQFCYYQSDLETLKQRVEQQAKANWAKRTNSSWSTAGCKSILKLIYPTFTVKQKYTVYIKAMACPYIPVPDTCSKSMIIMGAGVNKFCGNPSQLNDLKNRVTKQAIAAWTNYVYKMSGVSFYFYAACDRKTIFRSGSQIVFTKAGNYNIYAQAWGRPHLR